MRRLLERPEWQFFVVLPRADRGLAAAWWVLLVARGVLPAVFAVAMGWLVGAVQRGESLGAPLGLMGTTFVLLQVLTPVHQAVSANLGSRVSAYLNDALAKACVGPPGIGHLEDPELNEDLTVAREFDHGQTGPPMYLNVDFVAGSLVELVGGIASAVVLFGFTWWAPLRARRRLVRDALAASGERRLEGPEHRRGPLGAAARELRVRVWPSSRTPRRSCASSA